MTDRVSAKIVCSTQSAGGNDWQSVRQAEGLDVEGHQMLMLLQTCEDLLGQAGGIKDLAEIAAGADTTSVQ